MYQDVQAIKTDQLIEQYAPLVKRIAHHLMARLPASVQVDDLIQAGMIGLIEASKKYDFSKGASFETYAGIRIRGAMLDEIRRGDWVPRSVHRNTRMIADAIQRLEARLGRDAQDHEVAKELDISLDDYNAYLRDAASGRLFSFEDVNLENELLDPQSEQNPSSNPYEGLQSDDFRASLAAAIDALPEREKLVFALYYDEELNLKEIGQVLGVSESRVSQIHSQAALRLRARLGDWM